MTYICLRSITSGKIIRTYRSPLFGNESKNPDAAINNQLMYQQLRAIIQNIAKENDVEQMFKVFENESYYVRGIIGNPRRSGYIFLYKNQTLICKLGFCGRGAVAQRIWNDMDGQGFAPTPPFIAVKNEIGLDKLPRWTIYFIKLLSWAWLDYFDEEDANVSVSSDQKVEHIDQIIKQTD